MLYIEMDILTENVNSKNSKNAIDRFYLNNDHSKYSSEDIDALKKIIKECKSRKSHLYLLSYDFTSADSKKCFKNSLKSVKSFKESFDFLSDIEIRGMGSMERINESHLKSLPPVFIKQRIELIECHFDTKSINNNTEVPFYFNPNDYNLIEKYKTCLKGIIVQQILLGESFEMKIRASKPWTTSRRKPLNESNKENEDLQLISEMKYPNPDCSSILYPQNKPKITGKKITVQELTDRRSDSIVKYLSQLTSGMPIKFIGEGIGYKEGNPSIEIIISPYL